VTASTIDRTGGTHPSEDRPRDGDPDPAVLSVSEAAIRRFGYGARRETARVATVVLTGLPDERQLPLALEEARLLHDYMALNPIKAELASVLERAAESDGATTTLDVSSDDYLHLINAVNTVRAEGEPLGDGLRELGSVLHEYHAR
jgi:hypothetical protein